MEVIAGVSALSKTGPYIQANLPRDSMITTALEHIHLHHENGDGYITLAKKADRFKQWNFTFEQIEGVIHEWAGEDVYFSQNTLYKPRRRIETIRQLRSLYVDVDCYLFNLTPEWVIGKMELELFGQKVPEPNMIIHSGRGFVVVWFIDPAPVKALPLWQAIERYFAEQFKGLGGDTKATDAARIFRIAGSRNSKSGEEVRVQFRHPHRFALRQLQNDYLPELKPKKGQAAKGKKNNIRRLFNLYTLHHDRLGDLQRLIELRQSDCEGHRELICFLYRYWLCCFMDDASSALQSTLELNSEFKKPLPEHEVVRATRSAEAAAKDQKYKISNQRIIEWLEITPEEQKWLKSIIGREEKYSRNNKRRAEARRGAGQMDRGAYLAQAAERRSEARRMREEGYKNADIAEAIGVSIDTVKSFFRKV